METIAKDSSERRVLLLGMRALLSAAAAAAAAAVLSIQPAAALDNGVGLTPAMGYNTWDDFRCGGINSTNVMKVADSIVRYGLDKVGYVYLGLDDCWATSRAETGVIVPDPKAFPDGMKPVADYVHAKGLRFGIYTDRGTATCVGRPGSQGYEAIDAKTYASWGVDLVKEDSCSAPTDHNASFAQYGLMRDALVRADIIFSFSFARDCVCSATDGFVSPPMQNATGRPIYFALCGWSSWYAPVGASLGNSWRYGYDVNDWNSAYSNSIAASSALAADSGVGGWNDPDALIGTSTSTAVHMTEKQSRTQMTLWSMMAAPLEIGSNILSMNDYDLQTYKNVEVIKVDQDEAGMQGSVFAQSAQCNMAGGGMVGAAIDAWTGMTARQRRKRHEAAEEGQYARAAAGRRRPNATVTATGTCTALPDCQQIWTRNLTNGDVALAFVNYTQVLVGTGGRGSESADSTAAGPPQRRRLSRTHGGHMTLAACDATQPAQFWQLGATTSSGGMTTVKSMAGSKSCWEINGCGYRPGSGVDSGFGCKPLPAKGVTDPCCSNSKCSQPAALACATGQDRSASVRSGFTD
eukprot:SAG22_NODE_418_length_10750_cov_11.722280_11_plen_578_part_00